MAGMAWADIKAPDRIIAATAFRIEIVSIADYCGLFNAPKVIKFP